MINWLIPLVWLGTVLSDGDSGSTVDSTAQASLSVRLEIINTLHATDSLIVNVFCATSGISVAGFDLKMGTQYNQLEILDITQGQMQDSNSWGYFTAQDKGTRGPFQVWQVVSLAHSMQAVGIAPRLVWTGEQSIARVVLRVKEPTIYTDTLYPIVFLWEKCSDNSFSNASGTSLMVGKTAAFGVPLRFADPIDGLWIEGSQSDCFKSAERQPEEIVKFFGGGVVFRSADDTAQLDTAAPAAVEGLH